MLTLGEVHGISKELELRSNKQLKTPSKIKSENYL